MTSTTTADSFFTCHECGEIVVVTPGSNFTNCLNCGAVKRHFAKPTNHDPGPAAEHTRIAISALERIPSTPDRDGLIEVYRTLGNASLKQLRIWEAELADSRRSRVPHEFDQEVSVDSLRSLLSDLKGSRLRGADTRNRWLELIAAAVIGGLISWILLELGR